MTTYRTDPAQVTWPARPHPRAQQNCEWNCSDMCSGLRRIWRSFPGAPKVTQCNHSSPFPPAAGAATTESWLRHQILWPLLLFILEHFTFIFTIDYKIPEDEVRFLRSKEEVKMFSLNPSVIFQQLCQNVSYYVNGCEGGTETRWRWYPAMGKWGLNKYTINIHPKEKKKMGFGSWMSFLQSAGDTGMRERSRGKRNLEGREGLWKQKQTKNWGGGAQCSNLLAKVLALYASGYAYGHQFIS